MIYRYKYYIILILVSIIILLKIQSNSINKNPLLKINNNPIQFSQIKNGHIDYATEYTLSITDSILHEIISIKKNNQTIENTLLKLDYIYNYIYNIWNITSLFSSVHPDEYIRKEADVNDIIIQEYMVKLSINQKLYNSLKLFSDSKVAKSLSTSRKRFLISELRDFKSNGIHLPIDTREELFEIKKRIADLSIEFSNNITSNTDSIIFSEDMLDGLPIDYKNKYYISNDKYIIDLSAPSVDLFMQYALSDSARKKIRYKYLNIGYPDNILVLDEILFLRKKLANLLGYDSYAKYSIERSMAGNTRVVWDFENELLKNIKHKAKMDNQKLIDLKASLINNNSSIIYDWEKYFLENQYLIANHNLNLDVVREYFELNNVLEGLFNITEKLFGIYYLKVDNPSVWHEDVIMYEVYDENTRYLLGQFYMDLYPRNDKYQHAAEFTIRSLQVNDKYFQVPIACIVTNFSEPTNIYPSLLNIEEVETLFHEFGHLLHDILSKTELTTQSGTSVDMDFVEAPAQMFENWIYEKEVLQLIGKHYKDNTIIEDSIITKIIDSRNVQSGNDLLQQIFYGMLDLTFHDLYIPYDNRTSTEVLIELQNSITNYPYFPDTHQHTSFDHLIDYGASYYSYIWSDVYAQDMYSLFKKEGVLNSNLGYKFRKEIFEKGDSENAIKLVENFLGREVSKHAFLKKYNIE